MASLGDMFVKVGADISGFSAAMGSVKSTLNKTASEMKSVGTAMSAAFTLPMVGAGLAALKTAGDLEQTSIAFKTLLGSSQAATAHLQELKNFAMSTPFEFSELTLASKRMQALGFEAKSIIPTLTNIGDAASALGMGAEGVQRIVTALGQMKAKGMVQAEEMRQLAEAGIPAWQILAKTLNTDVAGAMKAVEARTVSAGIAIPAILAGMNEKFGGLMKAQSETMLGQWSNLKDKIYFTLADIGKTLAPNAKGMMENVFSPMLDVVKNLAKQFSELPPGIQNTVIALVALTAAIGPVTFAMGGMINMTTNAISLIGKYAAAIASLGASSLAQLVSRYQSVGAAYTTMLATGVLRVAGWAGVAYAVYDVVNAYLAMQDAQERVSKNQKQGADLLLEYEVRLNRQGVATADLTQKYNQGEISIEAYRKGLDRLRDEHLKLHPVLQTSKDAMEKQLLSAKAIKDAFADLGIKDLRTEIAEAEKAFNLLHASGKLTSGQMLEAANHVAKLRQELADLSKFAKVVPVDIHAIGPSLESLKNLPKIGDVFNLPTSNIVGSMSAISVALGDVMAAYRVAQGNAEDTAEAFRYFGETTGTEYEKMAKTAGENYEIMKNSGIASLDAQERAWAKWQRAVNEADFTMKRISKEEHDAREINLKDVEQQVKNDEKATKAIKRSRYDLGKELEEMSHRTFDSMERDLAKNIVSWKGWKETLVNVGKGFAEDFLAIMLKGLFKPLEDQFAKIAGKIGGWLGGIIGSSGSATGSVVGAAGSAAGGAGGAAGGVGGAVAGASSGLMGTITAISGVATAVSSIVGNFQFAGMNKSLDLIVNHTLRIFNEVFQQRIDHWDQFNGMYMRLGEVWNTLKDGGGAGGVTIDLRNSTFGAGVTKASMSDAFQQMYREAVAAKG